MPTRKWGSEKLVNTITAGGQHQSDVVALAGGGFVAVWQDDSGADLVVRAQRYDAVGSRAGSEFIVSTAAGVDQVTPTVTALADGGFFVSWEGGVTLTSRDILGKVYSSDGTFVREQRSTAIETAPDQGEPDVARLGTGSVAVWREPGPTDANIRARIFGADGTVSGTFAVTQLNGRVEDEPAVASAPDGSRFVVAWKSDVNVSDVMACVFDGEGHVLPAGSFTLNQSLAVEQFMPAVTWLNDGQFVATWVAATSANDIDTTIVARIFNGDGQALTGELAVNATTFRDQSRPAITALPGGGFAIAWADASRIGGDNSSTAIRLQAFDASGGKIGGEFLVNTTTDGVQSQPSITALADGRVVVTWSDASSGPDDVRMQVIDPRDGVVNGTGAGDTLYGHDLIDDEISGFAGNDLMRGLKGDDGLYGGAGNDDAYGGGGDDILFGGAGTDVLLGEAGDDDLFGEEGNDDLRGGAGADLHDGGAGADTANYAAATASVTMALDGSLAGTGDAAGDTFSSVEFIRGANVAGAGDVLRGDGVANSIFGNAGNDTLEGLGGADKLFGGAGTDTMSGGLGNDQFLFNDLTETPDTILDFSSNAAGNNDILMFKGSAFGGLAAGAITANQFEANTVGVATQATTRFVFDTDSEVLRFDANGNAAGGVLVIAFLQAGATMTFQDISIF